MAAPTTSSLKSQYLFIDEVICLLQQQSMPSSLSHSTAFITSFISFLEELFISKSNLNSFILSVGIILNETNNISTNIELEVHTQIFQYILSKIDLHAKNNKIIELNQILVWLIIHYVINDKNKLKQTDNDQNDQNDDNELKQNEFSLFDKVKIHSLQKQQHYNNVNGIIVNYNPSKKRFSVLINFNNSEKYLSLKATTITKVDDNNIYKKEFYFSSFCNKLMKYFTDNMIKQKTDNLCGVYDDQWNKKQFLLNSRGYVYKMPFYYKIFDNLNNIAPLKGRSLFISMHGGGGTTKQINDQQYINQQTLYDSTMHIVKGVYMALRAPTNTWDMWHQSQIDELLNIIIQISVIKLNVNINKIYILGYSAGGDGVYRIGTRMADRFAAVSMMAGHPGNCLPFNLNNTPFAIHVGEHDNGYKRNKEAIKWREMFNKLKTKENDNKSYMNCKVTVHKDKGHWMDLQDAQALVWMKQFKRNPYPIKIKWKQQNIFHNEFYWLSIDDKYISNNGEIIVEYNKNTNCINILQNYALQFNINVNNQMMNVNKPITICYRGQQIFCQLLFVRFLDLWHSYQYTGDKNMQFQISLTVINNKRVIRKQY